MREVSVGPSTGLGVTWNHGGCDRKGEITALRKIQFVTIRDQAGLGKRERVDSDWQRQ